MEYSKLGFTATTVDGVEKPQCILCNVVFCNVNLKPSKLSEHFRNKHGGVEAGYDAETLKTKRARYEKSGTLPKMGFTSVEKPHLASYKVAYRIAKEMKPHTLAEEVVKPCVIDMADIILGDGAARKLKQVALSNNTIARRIKDLSIDIRDQLISDLKASPLKISIQLDESTNVSNCSQLICFVRYIKEKKVEEEFLFCQPLPRTTTAKNIFKLVKEFFITHNLNIKVIDSVCSDGASSYAGQPFWFCRYAERGDTRVKNNSLPTSPTGSCFQNTTYMSKGYP